MALMAFSDSEFLRRHLKLDDQDGVTSLPNSKIFEQLALMGYHTDSDKLTFQKGAFSPQWRFLIHCILHCISPNKTAWEYFSSNIATAVICLATNRKFNFSRMIFEHMVSNITSPHKFLMYPRFIQICLDMQRHQLQQHTRSYTVPSLSMKVFNNMKRPQGYSSRRLLYIPTMLDATALFTSPSIITSSPSHSPEHSPSPTPSPSPEPTPDHTIAAVIQPSPTQPSPTLLSPGAEHNFPTPHDSPLHAVHSHGSDEGSLTLKELMDLVTKLSDRIGVLEDDLRNTKTTYSSAITKLILRVKKLEARVKIGKARRQARVVLSNDEGIADDSSKQGRKLSDVEVQEKASNETEPVIQDVTPTEVLLVKKFSIVILLRKVKLCLKPSDFKEKINENKEVRLQEMKRLIGQWDEEEGKELMLSYVWDFNQNIEPMDAEHGSGKQKSPEKEKSLKRCFVKSEHKEETKMEEDVRRRTQRIFDIYREEGSYRVFRGDGSSKNYKILSEMLEDFDRQDVEELYRLVKERYSASRPQGFDMMLWRDLHTFVELMMMLKI
ncbi:hypothetical protein Tco_0481028 [Tanacetum coccineum]